MLSILVIDTDPRRAAATCAVLEFAGHATRLSLMEPGGRVEGHPPGREEFDLAVIAPVDEDRALLAAYREIRKSRPTLPLIAMATADTMDAFDGDDGAATVAWVPVPLRQTEFRQALERLPIPRRPRPADPAPRHPELFRHLVGTSEAVQRLRELVMQVADSDATVLLTGESGTGKEVVARRIHFHSGRRHKPFVPVNCGAIPSELLESELFGHEKGAFTGAIGTRRGRFEMAAGGTLFLDEIGDMPAAMQVKLLRVIQEKSFERVGSNETLDANVRILAATHTDLEQGIRVGRFREDLYYRLNVFPIAVPPLRDRIEDLPLLIKDLLERLSGERKAPVRLTAEALELLQRYPWPGNVRELANLVERLAILYPGGVVDVPELPEQYRRFGGEARATTARPGRNPAGSLPLVLPPEGLDLKAHLATLERELIDQALDDAAGVVSHAARRLRLGRTTLVEKMRKYGIRRRQRAR